MNDVGTGKGNATQRGYAYILEGLGHRKGYRPWLRPWFRDHRTKVKKMLTEPLPPMDVGVKKR